MGQSRLPGPDCSVHGTARNTEVADGYSAVSATWGERIPTGSEFTPEEREMILDVAQALLDLLGIVDQTGLSDLTNAAISFRRDDYVGGWIGVIAVIPVLGDVAKIPRIATHIAKIKRAMNQAKRSSPLYAAIRPPLHSLSNVLDKLDSLQSHVGKMAREINEPIKEFLGKVGKVPGKILAAAVTNAHRAAFKRVAKKHGVFIVLRKPNDESLKWIAKGFPSKPMEVKAKTSSKDGLVIYEGVKNAKGEKIYSELNAVNPDSTAIVTRAFDDILSSNYGIVNNEGGNWVMYFKETSNGPIKTKAFTPIEGVVPQNGHVIHLGMNKPFTADYDLLEIINPNDPSINKVSLRLGQGNPVASSIKNTSISNPYDDQIIRELNAEMGEARILHGVDERFQSLDAQDDILTIFFPDGETVATLDRKSDDFLKTMENFRKRE